jgi:hypothetical protein
MFEGLDAEKGPFSNTMRILLLDHLLNNLAFNSNPEETKLKFLNTVRNIIKKNLHDYHIKFDKKPKNLQNSSLNIEINDHHDQNRLNESESESINIVEGINSFRGKICRRLLIRLFKNYKNTYFFAIRFALHA